MSWLHDRQPAILKSDADVAKWLDTSSHAWSTELGKLFRPTDGLLWCVFFFFDCISGTDGLYSYQVPKEVGKVGAESAAFVQPVATRKDGIEAMFAKQRTKQEGSKEGIKRKRSLISSVQSEPSRKEDQSHKTECKKLKVE